MDTRQNELVLKRPMPPVDSVDMSMISRLPTFTSSIRLCGQMGGFKYEHQIYNPLGIDAGHWTRITNGTANFPQDKIEDFMDHCGNEIPLIWLNDRRGYQMKRRLSDLERENEALRQEIRDLEIKMGHLIEFTTMRPKT